MSFASKQRCRGCPCLSPLPLQVDCENAEVALEMKVSARALAGVRFCLRQRQQLY
jgi:hypothetical protein